MVFYLWGTVREGSRSPTLQIREEPVRTVTQSSFIYQRKIAASKLAAIFRSARHKLGASQEEVAHAAGLAVPTYSALERGETATGELANPTLDTVMRVAFALELELPEFPRALPRSRGEQSRGAVQP